jgi:HSP20 family protein
MLYNIVHRDFFGEMDRLNRFAENFFGNAPERSRVYEPAINLRREEGGLLVEASVPGFTQDELELQLKEQVLELTGSKCEAVSKDSEEASQGGNYEVFKRRIRLPFKVDFEKIKTSLEHGILRVRFEETPEDKPLKIEINAS